MSGHVHRSDEHIAMHTDFYKDILAEINKQLENLNLNTEMILEEVGGPYIVQSNLRALKRDTENIKYQLDRHLEFMQGLADKDRELAKEKRGYDKWGCRNE